MNRSDVFVSYRRTDVEFCKQVVAEFQKRDYEVWVDWEDIPPGSTGFSDDIRQGIEGADAFLAILSPNYLQSTYCVDMELGYALELNKRIIPVVYEKFEGMDIPSAIGHINWVYFVPHAGQANEFDESFERVLAAMTLDFDHAKSHTRLLLKAQEWDKNERNSSYLIGGSELEEAETWLANAINKDPDPTQLQVDFISNSQVAQKQRQRRILIGVSTALVVSILLTIYSVFATIDASNQRDIAQDERVIAEEQRDIANQQREIAEEAQAVAVEQRGIAEEQRDLAEVAEALAVEQSNRARSLALASQSDIIHPSNQPLALGLALESLNVPNPSELSREALANSAYNFAPIALIPSDIIGDSVYYTEFTNDGSQIITVDSIGRIRIYDAITHALVNEISTDTPLIKGALSADNTAFATFDTEGTLKLYDFPAFTERLNIPLEFPAEQLFTTLLLTDDASRIYLSSAGASLWVFDTETGDEIEGEHFTSELLEFGVNAMTLTEDEQFLYTVLEESILEWETATMTIINQIDTGFQFINLINRVFEGSDFDSVLVANGNELSTYLLDSGQQEIDIVAHELPLTGMITFVNDDQITGLLTGSTDGSVKLWDANEQKVLNTFNGHAAPVSSIGINPQRTQIVSGDANGDVIIWSLENLELTREFNFHTASIRAFDLLDDNTVISGQEQGLIYLWEISDESSLSQQAIEFDPESRPNDIEINPARTEFAISLNTGAILVYDLNTGDLNRELAHETEIHALNYSSDGSRFVTSDNDGHSIIWDATTGAEVLRVKREDSDSTVFDNHFFDDDSKFITAHADGLITIWDANTGEQLDTITIEDQSDIRSIALNSDETILATALESGSIITWNMIDYSQIAMLIGHTGAVTTISFSDDDQLLISGSHDRSVRIWDLATNNQIRQFDRHETTVWRVAITSDGTKAISASDDTNIYVWDLTFSTSPIEEQIQWVCENRYSRPIPENLWELYGLEELHTFCESDS